MRLLSLIAVVLTACTYEFPDPGEPGAYGCRNDSDCLAGFVCKNDLCVEGKRGGIQFDGSCDAAGFQVTPALAVSPSSVTPGTAVQIIAQNVGDNPDDPCSRFDARWFICDAPATSTFFSATGCQLQDNDGQNSFTFTPERAGTYTVKLARHTDEQTVVIATACTDAAVTLAPSNQVEPGTAVTARAPSAPAAPDECSLQNGSWWICDAPATSAFNSGTGDGCTQQSVGQPNTVFVPDLVGSYTVELRRPGGKLDEATLGADCNAAIMSKSPTSAVLPGATVTVTASITSPAGACAAPAAEWWVCDAPADSSFFDASGCFELVGDGDNTLAFVPDTAGDFRIELRRGSDVSDITVSAACAAATLVASPSTGRAYAGLPITVTATDLPASGTCAVAGASWWLCPTQTDCTSPLLDTNCTELTTFAAQNAATVSNALRGDYALELCRPGRTDAQAITVLADALIAEVTFANPQVTRQLGLHSISEVVCRVHRDQASCAADTASNCAWDVDLNLCWDTCTYPETCTDCPACADVAGCTWNGDTVACEREVDVADACVLAANETECATVMTPGAGEAGCLWDTQQQACLLGIDCASAGATTQEQCLAAGCQWDEVALACTGTAGINIPEPSFVQLYSDGSAVAPLRYRDTNPIYRFDPNNIFLPVGVRTGTAQNASQYGVAVDAAAGVAVIPHMYLYTRPGDVGLPRQCGFSAVPIFWRQGSALGVPSLTLALMDHQSNLLNAVDTPVPGLLATIAYPNLLRTGGGNYRVTFGRGAPVDELSDCESLVTGEIFADMMFSVLPMALTIAEPPMSQRLPMEIWVADVDTTLGQRTSSVVSVPVDTYPCDSDEDCPDLAAGSCVSGKCNAVDTLEGYLPRLVAHNASPGRALLFSHASCSGANGSACDGGSGGIDYDLVLARIDGSTGTFLLESASFIAHDPTVQELDAFLINDVFGTGTVYYLGISSQLRDVQTEAHGTVQVQVPYSGLYKVVTTYVPASKTWTAGAPINLLAGTATLVTAPAFEPTPCKLDAVQDMVLTSSWEADHPIQFAMSPDRRYLAYSLAHQPFECHSVLRLGEERGELIPGQVTSSDIYVIDSAGSGLPVRVYDASCVEPGPLGPINLMPVFIAGGEQLVFSSGTPGLTGQNINQFYRFNLSDLNESAPGCNITQVATPSILNAGLAQVSPTLVPMGVALADSRTFIQPGCSSCQALAPDILTLLGLTYALRQAMRWRKRRRG